MSQPTIDLNERCFDLINIVSENVNMFRNNIKKLATENADLKKQIEELKAKKKPEKA
jgi:DNA-directed RNA polymerase alpha subunit